MPATTQPAPNDSTRIGWWTAATLGTLKLAQKVMDFLRIRASFEERMYLRLEANFRDRIRDLETRIQTLEVEKSALQRQNSGQQAKIDKLEREIAADKELRHRLRAELQKAQFERDAARAENERLKRDGKQ